ncbi:DUF3857 domain-containing transglutaminase family protein [Chitinophagaceae bacterium LB-8]|uniref:DUF3857 domain-containing transglutaminase family protein n=1 Tax=Paraflavisolibacter caeni TaxID=2982496 RepID=A0A9X2XWT2_9BACT|nr:DUF3857 domain-containing transglutaminase family protein [Paraflavisolibacter caeni]MCU7550691.1 DUF3857 domain-containing transglutaminase family protein [Paraflavisolibacter caeni]
MKLTSIILLNLFMLLPFVALRAQKGQPKVESAPNWITQNTVDYTVRNLDHEADNGYVDLVYEKQVSLIHSASYYKVGIKILSEAGVQNSSELSVNFDPSYQDLCFHSIRIIRGANSINKLHLSKIKIIQKEKELDRFIYDGSLTAVLLLDDVRKGDIIEYSYTIKGMNPIFSGKYADVYDTRFSVPVYQLYYKLVSPKNRNLFIKNNQVSLSPAVTTSANETTYEWKLANVPSLHVEDHLPSWYDAYPTVMVSEFKSWKEVSDWALNLYPVHFPLSPEMKNTLEEIKKKDVTPEGRILTALRLVQDEVRYMGVEVGPNSHRPHDPGQVLVQRFGDCKDKSYLLCCLLRGMGIDASPVFINTSFKKTVGNWLPSPKAFDHVTVRVVLNGAIYFFDPTISYQRGRLQDISFPDYQAGLVITDTTTSITSIPLQEKGMVNVKEVFNVLTMAGTARLVVNTMYTGSYADDVRSDFQSTSLYEKKKDYLDFYSDYFEKINADSLSYIDNEQDGSFTTIEYYTINDFWGASNSFKKASFEPFVINGVIRKPKEEPRKMPFDLVFPAHYHEDIEVNLPEAWKTEESSEKINGPGFVLNYAYNCIGSRVLLKYEYENLKDHVLPEETKAFLASMKKVDESIGYRLTQTIEDSSVAGTTTSAFSSHYTSLYLVLGLCVLITIMMRKGNNY